MSTFQSRKITRRFAQKYAGDPVKIFPMLCAVREIEWIPQWEYEMIYSISGVNERGCIFKTQKPYGTETVWVTTKWDTDNYEVRFVQFAKDSLVVNLKIALDDNGDGTTTANWEQVFTSLSEKGNEFIESYTIEKFQKVMGGLQKAMNHYLETGKLIGT